MTDLHTAAKLALEALEKADSREGYLSYITEIEALREALASEAKEQPAQEPAQRYSPDGEGGMEVDSLGAWVKFTSQQPPAQPEQPAQEPVAFLANGTRFKMSFFENEDGPGTHVTCFEAFEKELDGRWVALVAAEDDCHRNLTHPQAREPLTDEQVAYILGQLPKPPTNDGSALHDWAMQAVHELAAHGITGEKK